MQSSKTDLDRALRFVVRRISEQAQREGQPLVESERGFLLHLPKHPTNPTLQSAGQYPGDSISWAYPLRDFEFERLCSLAKRVYVRHRKKPRSTSSVELCRRNSRSERPSDGLATAMGWNKGQQSRSRYGRLLALDQRDYRRSPNDMRWLSIFSHSTE